MKLFSSERIGCCLHIFLMHVLSSSPVYHPEDSGFDHGGMCTMDVTDEANLHHLSAKEGKWWPGNPSGMTF